MRTIGTLLLLAGTCLVMNLCWRASSGSVQRLAHAAGAGRLSDSSWTIDLLVGDVAAALLLVAVAGLVTQLLLSAVAVLLRDRTPRLSAHCDRLTPRTLRRMVAACCGVGLAVPFASGAPALAYDDPRPACHQPCGPGALDLGGLHLPDLPASWPLPVEPRSQLPDHVVVRAGDSLWQIAAGRLPITADAAEIEALTTQLYQLNRPTIGADPDVIYPGMTLIAPESRP